MAPPTLTCPVCGNVYNPSGRNACGSCPLNSGCEMVCCPNCGHTTIDPSNSRLVRLVTKLFSAGKRDAPAVGSPLLRSSTRGPAPSGTTPERGQKTLLEGAPSLPPARLDRVPPGTRARVESLDRRLAPDRQVRLQAYGVVPGFWVEVIQQTPVTIVRIDHLELALEKDLAAGIWVRCEPSTEP